MSDTKKLDVDVNQFPSLTWNFLNINKTHLETEIASEAVYNSSFAAKEVPFAELSDEVKSIETGLGREFDDAFDQFCNSSKTAVFSKNGTEPVNVVIELKDGQSSAKNFVINAEEDSEVSFTFVFKSDADVKGTTGARIRVIAKENAKVKLSVVNLLSTEASYFVSIGGSVSDNALVDVTEIQLGGKKVYTGNYQQLSGYKAQCTGHTAYLVHKDSALDINYVANQTGRETYSFMAADGICDGNAVKTWRGTINFVKGCVEAKGDEQENVLLLSPKVVNKTLPVILCDEEAVEGRHGASIGKLGKEILFYMQSRGVDEKEAQRLMILAKINSACRFIPDASVVEEINEFLNKDFGEC